MIRKAHAEWRGTGKDGNGDLTTDSGVLSKTAYSFKTRFQGEKGTNPEELIAAAHAGCFTMALAFQLQTAGFTPTSLSTEAAVSLDQEGAEAGVAHQFQRRRQFRLAVADRHRVLGSIGRHRDLGPTAAEIVRTMQLAAEVAEIHRRIPGAIARIDMRQRHLVAKEMRALDLPASVDATEHEQTLAGRDQQLAHHGADTTRPTALAARRRAPSRRAAPAANAR